MFHFDIARRFMLLVLSGILATSGVLLLVQPVQAQSLSELQQQLKEAEAAAERYRNLAENEKEKADKYAKESADAAARIGSVQASINATLNRIKDKESNIEQTHREVEEKIKEIDKLKQERDHALVLMYQLGDPSTVEMMLSGQTISDYDTRAAYLQSFGNNLLSIIDRVHFAKKELEDRQTALEQQRKELAQLKGEQEAQKGSLESLKRDREVKAATSKQKEAQYEDLAEKAEAKKEEFNRQLTRLLRSGGPVIRKGSVKKGDVIGYMGTSGFSSGPHLHFETRMNGTPVNPRGYTPGRLSWPFASFRITQEFGQNWKLKSGRWAYASGHSGMDMVANGGYGSPVFAAGDGELIEPFPQYNGYMPGGYGYYRVIDHGGGLITMYGHLTN